MRARNNKRLGCFIFLWLISPQLLAENVTAISADPGTRNQDIQINADHMKFDIETGSSHYTGKVKIVQGSITLTGERVSIHRNNDEISTITVDGEPARYLQDDGTQNRVNAISNHMEYTTNTNRLVLTDNASLQQAGQTVASQRIVYDTQNKVILAGSDSAAGENNERVNITLTPNKATSTTGLPAQ